MPRRSVILSFAMLMVAGCAGGPQDPSAPDGSAGPSSAPAWREAVRLFEIPAGDTFGVLLLKFAPEDAIPDAGPSFGLQINASAITNDSYVRVYVFAQEGAEWALKAAVGTIGSGGFGLGAGDGTDSPTLMFAFVLHAPEGGELRVTQDTGPETSFDLPIVDGTWNASGDAEISVYQALENRGGSVTPFAYNIAMEGTAGPSNPGHLDGGATILSTSHRSELPSVEISTALICCAPMAGSQRVTWKNGGETTEKAFPAAGVLFPVVTGYRLVDIATGPTAIRVETAAATVSGGIAIEHNSLRLDPAILGIAIKKEFDNIMDEVPARSLNFRTREAQ